MAAYLVAGATRIDDPSAFEHWRTLVAPLIAAHGGKVLAAGELVEGEWQPRCREMPRGVSRTPPRGRARMPQERRLMRNW